MLDDTPSAPAAHPRLAEARGALTPTAEARVRVRGKMLRRIEAPAALRDARAALTPSSARQVRAWLRIRPLLQQTLKASVWHDLRDRLQPSSSLSLRVWQALLPRLAPAVVHPHGRPAYRALKFVAAFAVLLLVVRISPFLFLAPPTVADSQVSVILTRGNAAVLRDGLWQPIYGEVPLQQEAVLRTENGEATIVFHDDAVIRLAPYTTVAMQDLTNRPSEPVRQPTLALQEGQLWVLGLLPRPLEPIRIGTTQAQVEVQEGSIAVREDADAVVVEAWDRGAAVLRRGTRTQMFAGEQLTIRQGTITVTQNAASHYQETWVASNLARDAVHQHEIAQMQQERRASAAGILPDSTFYPAKRLVEAVDVLFTFGNEARTKKRITHANTRLNEAAALISRGSGPQATAVLVEYRETLLSIATGSGGSKEVRSLLQEEALENAVADTAAALPSDDAYLLKETVRETIAQLPDGAEGASDALAAEIFDRISQVRQQIAAGEATVAGVSELQTFLDETESSGTLSPDVLDEARESLTGIVAVVDGAPASGDDDETASESDSESSRPPRRSRGEPSARPALSDAEVDEKVQGILASIRIYDAIRSQRNQLLEEMRALETHPDKGRILRRLHQKELPGGLSQLVRREIGELNEETQAEIEQQIEEGTGAVLP